MTDTRETHRIKMRPRARLVNLIGEELISEEEVAIVELVKNAYDANAKKVSISFETSGLEVESIVIEDDGDGMTLETVRTAWFEPGTIYKKNISKHSSSSREYQGEKGIGRFAAAKLGKQLKLQTKHEEQNQEIEISLDWEKFNSKKYLEEIETECKVSDGITTNHGTTLTIQEVRKDIWDDKMYDRLKYRLSRLISPHNKDKNFIIELKYPGKLLDAIRFPPFIEKPRYRYEGKLIISFNDRGEKEYRIDGILTVPESILNIEEIIMKKYPVDEKLTSELNFGEFLFDIKVWDREAKSLNFIAKKFGLEKGKNVRDTLNKFCGVSLYRDGFRIHPYGDSGNDWLKLDQQTRQNPTMKLANNQVIGSIEITREGNPHLIDKSSRDGLIHNIVYDEFVEFLQKYIFPKIEKQRYEIRKAARKKRTEKSIPESVKIIKFIFQNLQNDFKVGNLNYKTLSDSEKNVTLTLKSIEELYSRLVFSAGLGQMAQLIMHEIRAPIGKVRRLLYAIQVDMKKDIEFNAYQKHEKNLNNIYRWLQQHGDLCDRLSSAMPNKLGRAYRFIVAEEIQTIIDFFSPAAKQTNITIELNNNIKNSCVTMSQSVVTQIFHNLLDNAIYWTSEKHKNTKEGKIIVTLDEFDEGFIVKVEDNGNGVSEEDRNLIFDIYYTKKKNGHGIGLYICKRLIEKYGEIKYSNDSILGGGYFITKFIKKLED